MVNPALGVGNILSRPFPSYLFLIPFSLFLSSPMPRDGTSNPAEEFRETQLAPPTGENHIFQPPDTFPEL